MENEIPKSIDNKIDTNIHPVNRIYNLTEEEIEKLSKESSEDKHIKFIKSIGGMKDVEITSEMKQKMAEDLERFWRDTPLDQIAELS
jgi:ribosomal protein S13